MERLQLLRAASSESSSPSILPFVRFKKKGSRIASQIQLELHSFSVTIIQSFKTVGMRPFIKFHSSQLKLSLSGCMDAMNGEFAAHTQLEFFHPKHGFEDVIQSNMMLIVVDQIPNELILSLSSPDVIVINITGALIQELSNLERTIHERGDTADQVRGRFNFVNETGVEVMVGMDSSKKKSNASDVERDINEDYILVPPRASISLDSTFTWMQDSNVLSLGAKNRQTIHDLPLFPISSSRQCSLFYPWYTYNDTLEGSDDHVAEINIAPVVEFVMQNERLCPGVNDVLSLERGQDLLSSIAWSPVSSRNGETSQNRPQPDSFWRTPYLEDDAFDWSDMTSVIRKKKDSFVLPNGNWTWISDWQIDIDRDMQKNDADGWEYATDFETFDTTPRTYQRGDLCRRRRWTRTRMLSHSLNNSQVSSIVWDITTEEERTLIKVRSHFQLNNHTNMDLSFFGACHFGGGDIFIGNVASGASLSVPLHLASATHVRLATPKKSQAHNDLKPSINDFFSTEKIMIVPTTSNRIIRSSILCEQMPLGFLSMRKLHFLLTIKCVEGGVDLHVESALKVINLLPCELQCQVGEIESIRKGVGKISQTEAICLGAGAEGKCLSADCTLCPHVSVRIPGYKWSCWKRIVNRDSKDTWRLTEEEELALYEAFKDSADHATEFKSIVHFDHMIEGGASIDIVMTVEMDHSPTIRFYAQYWILDKTCLSLNFTGGFSDFMQSTPEKATLRKSYLLPVEVNDRRLHLDIEREGHEWSFGSCGMILFFSRNEKIALSVEGETGWTPLIDVSTVMPESVKTTISIDQSRGTRRFELAFNITLCPSIFSRTRMITIFPRYQVVNLLEGESLYIAQDGALRFQICIPSQSSVPFHWSNSSLHPKIRIRSESGSWSQGCIQLDKIGVTAMRIPSSLSSKTIVVQVEVRLASKKQDSAIVVTIWASIEKSNPLYLLQNSSQQTILCKQMLGREGVFVWNLNPGESVGFGFDDPEAPHVLEWTGSNMRRFLRTVEVDDMGSMSSIATENGSVLTAKIQAHRSTKVILFSDASVNDGHARDGDAEMVEISLRINLTGIAMSVIDNASNCNPGREILLLTAEGWHASFSQRQGYHEFELRLTRLQVDNFIFNAEHPVMVSTKRVDLLPYYEVKHSFLIHKMMLRFIAQAMKIFRFSIFRWCVQYRNSATLSSSGIVQ